VIAPGVILIRNDARLPETLMGGVSPFCHHWSFLSDNSDRQVLETRLAILGWTSSCLSGAIRRASTGIDKQKMIKTALERVLEAASLKSCNLLEIGEIKTHLFLTIRYASVSGHARQLQAGNSPVISQWAR
jgi:hypothetical protein